MAFGYSQRSRDKQQHFRELERMATQAKLQSAGGTSAALGQGLQALSQIFMRLGLQRSEAEAAAAQLQEQLAFRREEGEKELTFRREEGEKGRQSDLDIATLRAQAQKAGAAADKATEEEKRRQKIADEYRKRRFDELKAIMEKQGQPDTLTGEIAPSYTPAQIRAIEQALLEAQSIEDMDLDKIIDRVTNPKSLGKADPGFGGAGGLPSGGESPLDSLGQADPGLSIAGGLPQGQRRAPPGMPGGVASDLQQALGPGFEPSPPPWQAPPLGAEPGRGQGYLGSVGAGPMPTPPGALDLEGGFAMDPLFQSIMDEYVLGRGAPPQAR